MITRNVKNSTRERKKQTVLCIRVMLIISYFVCISICMRFFIPQSYKLARNPSLTRMRIQYQQN